MTAINDRSTTKAGISGSISYDRRKRCFAAFTIMLLLFLPYIIWEPISSDTNDDTAMNLIAAGAFGDNSQYLVYINVLYGYLLKALFTLMPSINWYLYLALIFNFLSAALIGMALAYFIPNFKKLFVVLIILHFFIAGEFYQSVQFTRNGYLYAICSIIMLTMSTITTSYRKTVCAVGGFFLFLAFLIRMECFVPMAPFGLVLLLWCFFKNKRSCIMPVITLGITLCACACAYIANQKLFNAREEWAAYFFYHQNGSSPLLDRETNHWFSFDADNYAIEYNDLLLLNEYQYADYSYFSVERLKQLQHSKEAPGLSELFTSLIGIIIENNSLQDIPDHVYFSSQAHYLLYTIERYLRWNILFDILLSIYAVYLIKKKRISIKELFWLFLFAGCMLLDLFAIISTGHTPRRATIGPRIAMEIYSLFVLIAADKKIHSNNENAINFRLLIAPLAAFLFISCIRISDHVACPKQTETSMILSELKNIEGEYYLMDAMILWGERLGISDMRTLTYTEYADFFEHFCLSGGWLAETPHATHYMNEQGITTPMTQLGSDPHSHYIVRSWKAEYLVPLMADYISRRQGFYPDPQAIYAGDEIMIVDFYAPGVQ